MICERSDCRQRGCVAPGNCIEDEPETAQRVQELERQLAEAQAREAELRAALMAQANFTSTDGSRCCFCTQCGTCEDDPWCLEARAALAIPTDRTALDRAIAEAVAAEREACVEACVNEQVDGDPDSESDEAYNRACDDCAGAIKERGQR